MAKKKRQPKRDAFKDIVKYLYAGKSLEDAASCAGVSHDEAVSLIGKSTASKDTLDIANVVATDVLRDSLAVLKDLANHGDSEEVRLGAAKELRRFAFDLIKINKPTTVTAEITIEQKDLWDS